MPRDGSTSLISIAWETFNTVISKAHVHRPISSREETVNSRFSVTSFRPTRWSRSTCNPRLQLAAFAAESPRSRRDSPQRWRGKKKRIGRANGSGVLSEVCDNISRCLASNKFCAGRISSVSWAAVSGGGEYVSGPWPRNRRVSIVTSESALGARLPFPFL